MSQYQAKLTDAFNNGLLNSYMYEKACDACKSGVDSNVFNEILKDAILASKAGVKDDKKYGIYFFARNFIDDILRDTFSTKISDEEKNNIYEYLLGQEDYNFDNLLDYRLAIHKWLSDRMSKKSYPNISGKFEAGPRYDINKWVSTLRKIYLAVSAGIEKQQAIEQYTIDWEIDEKKQFLYWMDYYESGTAEKYKVKNAKLIKSALMPASPQILEQWVNPETRYNMPNSPMTTVRVPQKTQRELEMEQAKRYRYQMRSRLRSLKKLLDKFNDLMPKSNWTAVNQEIFNLDQKIGQLEIYASMRDSTIKTANRLKKLGFFEGYDFLTKIAETPVGPEVVQSLPAGTSPDPQPKQPSAGVGLQSVIDRLEGVGKRLKSRTTVRELASIDILLNEMGLASYFPEITDAQAKLIEAYGYASNKVESVTAKLRGTGSAKPEPVPEVAPLPQPTVAPKKQKVDKEEIMQAPPGQIRTTLPPTK